MTHLHQHLVQQSRISDVEGICLLARVVSAISNFSFDIIEDTQRFKIGNISVTTTILIRESGEIHWNNTQGKENI